MATPSSIASRFKGALMGAIFGDCLGANFEMGWCAIPHHQVISYLKNVKERVKLMKMEREFVLYTDDSCMTFDLGESLVEHEGFNPQDVAKRFSETYYASSAQRFYGGNVVSVFHRLREMNYEGDVFGPAQKQFDGSGSYGNGSAMRVSPVPLFHHDNIPDMVKLATDQSRLTHSNPLGINGAILQSLAIEKALKSEKIAEPVEFCKELIQQLEEVTPTHEDIETYSEKMNHVIDLLTADHLVKDYEINESVGSDVTAQEAVPAAIFSFLYTLDEKRIPSLATYSGVVRAAVFAVAFSKDSDTIGSMAAAIAGAYYGLEAIPEEWIQACEGGYRAIQLADNLFAINQDTTKKNS